ncbi:type III-A CRISPR-associated protein Csm2 [Proteiniphilum propionicum]|jgi:CRISPR-associated protein Csm2|uniref:type III-A CRISPR-associated protein Csm2 n=1 Tax=Proteiniphilum propionicum TaxID=2829812 RepID=UPI001EEB2686|nr:type III-A CRISPR-associated protein Csm2 [Proteiniphilum propionicum]ULB35857.1 type III-A CRISPR-associated protein Csm2 [Proteiniphilum propionicum]
MAEKLKKQFQSKSNAGKSREVKTLHDFAQEVKSQYFEEALFEQLLQLNTSDIGLQKKLPVDTVITAVEKFVKAYSDAISPTQLRNIYSKIKGVTSSLELKLLRPNLAYVAARQQNDREDKAKKMIAFIDLLIQKTDDDSLDSFKKLMEIIIAYHKFYNTKK